MIRKREKINLDDQLTLYNKISRAPIPIISLLPKEQNEEQNKKQKKNEDKRWFINHNNKIFGPYNVKQLIKLYKLKKITKRHIIEGEESKKSCTLIELFTTKGLIKKKIGVRVKKENSKSNSERIAKFITYLAVSDGKIDKDEIKFLKAFCKEKGVSTKIIKEMIEHSKGNGPPPISLIDEHFDVEDFYTLVKMCKADGEIQSSELRMLNTIYKKLKHLGKIDQSIRLKELIDQA